MTGGANVQGAVGHGGRGEGALTQAFLGEELELFGGFQDVDRAGFVDLVEFAVGEDGRGRATAAEAFARANEMAPRAATKYNEAFAWGKAGNVAAAADAYEAALELGLEGKLAEAANDRIVELKRELGYLVVPGPPGGKVSVAHAEGRPVPAKIHLPVGAHTATLQNGDGASAEVTVKSAAGVSTILEVPAELTTPDPAPETPAPLPNPVPGDGGDEGNGTVMTALGWTAVGLAGAATAATIATGVLTLQKVSAYDDGGNVDAELRDEATTLRLTTNVMIGVSSGLAVTGLLLLLLAPDGSDDGGDGDDVAFAVGPGGGAISWRW